MKAEQIESKIVKSNNSIKKLLNRLKLIDDEEVASIVLQEIKIEKNKIKELEDKKKKIINESTEISINQAKLFEFISDLEEFNNTFENLNLEDKQKYLNALIKQIKIDENNNLNIEFNLKKN